MMLLLLGAFFLAAQPSSASRGSTWRNINRAWRNGGENSHLAAPSLENSGTLATPSDGSVIYIIRLNAAPPLSEYRGGIAGYPATATWDDGSDEEDEIEAIPQMILSTGDSAAAASGESVDLDDTNGDQLLSNATVPSPPANGASHRALRRRHKTLPSAPQVRLLHLLPWQTTAAFARPQKVPPAALHS
ncbi:unnamed protein product [Closterium sp. NIES-53]